MKRSSLGILFLPMAILVSGCSGGLFGSDDDDGSFMSAVEIAVTDAPFENWMVEKAVVRIDAVRLHEDANGTDNFLTIMEGKELSLDLTKLTNGLTELMVRAAIPPGEYAQARLNITGGYIRLHNGKVFSTEDGTMLLSNFPASGFKVPLAPAVHAHSGVTMRLLLDFDLSKSFRPVPADDPLNANSVLLLPALRCVDVLESGEIRGIVEEDVTGTMTSVEDAFVYVLPPGEADMDNRIATTGTEEDGSFALLGLDPGTYDIVATKGGVDRRNSITVSKGGVTTVDLELQ